MIMTKDFFDTLNQWQQAPGRRTVQITLGDSLDKNYLNVWVYDFDAMEGLHLKSEQDLEGLDLKAQKRETLTKQLEALEEASLK